MSMEFLCWPYLEGFYGTEAHKARAIHLGGALSFLPYGCQVDEFQHIVYENPDMTPEERNAQWAALDKKYRPWLDFDSVPFYADGAAWQRQIHIYTDPFYYIDYCLAQSVALQIFRLMEEKGWQAAFDQYLAYTRQGGNDTFLGLLQKAGGYGYIRGDKHQHGGHIGMDHAAALSDAPHMAGFPANLEFHSQLFLDGIRGHDGFRRVLAMIS